MAENNRNRIIKVAGYAKRVFFNDNIEYRNFSPDLVGLQLTSDGGSALFTMGNFNITTNAAPSQYTVFNLGTYSRPYTLNDVTSGDEEVLLIQKNQIAGLNLDLTNPLSYIWYGSAEEMFRVSLTFIRDYFPAAIYVDDKIGSLTGNNITNYSYDPLNDESSFSASTNYFNNLFNIKYTTSYKYQTSHKNSDKINDKDVYDESDTGNLLRNFTLQYGKYVIEHNNISKNIKRVTTPSVETDSVLTIVTEGNPFPELTGIDFSSYTFLNNTFDASIPFFIKPNEVEQQNFFSSLNNLEKNLLNLDIIPKYTMVITKPEFSDDGVLVFIEDRITFPLEEDGYNLNFFDSIYLSYLNQLTEYGNALDNYSTDIILRKYTTDAVSSFDTIPRGDGNDLTLDGEKATKLFRIYGREFDEVKQYIDGIKMAHIITYDKKNNTPDSLVKDLSLMLGLDGFSFLNNFNIKQNVLPSYGDVTYSGISKTLSNQELDIEIYRRLILNIAWIWKSKGARKAVEFLFRFIGAPESLVNFNEYIVMVDKPLNMEKIKQLLYIYTGSADLVDTILLTIPYDEKGYPLPPSNGDRVIVDYIAGDDLQAPTASIYPTNLPSGNITQPIYFEDYDLNNDGKIDVQDLNEWVKKKDDGEITVAELSPIVQDLYQFIIGGKPLPPNISTTQPLLGNLPGIVESQERDMWFQKAGGWYRETAGAFASITELAGNNPHVGSSIDSDGTYSTYDGGSEYLSIFSRCYIPNFKGTPKITTTATTLYENNFINYNYGIFNGVPTDTTIYTSFLSLDNQPVDGCIIVTPTIITTPYNPEGITTIESIYLQAEAEYTRWLNLIKEDSYLKYSPEWEVVKNNYNIAQQNRAREINTESCGDNLTLELCIDKDPQGDAGGNTPGVNSERTNRYSRNNTNPCELYVVDKSNPPYIVFRDPSIAQNPIVSFNDFPQCCEAEGGTYKQFIAPDGSTAEYCATNAPCAGKRLETRKDGVVVFEMVKGNFIPDNIYNIIGKCYQLTSTGEKYFNSDPTNIPTKVKGETQDLSTYIRKIEKTKEVPASFYNYFTEVTCGENRTIVSSPECCAWNNLNFHIDEQTGQVHCIDQDYINNIESTTSGKPLIAILEENIKNVDNIISKKIIELENENLTVVDKKKIEAEIIKGNVDKLFLEDEEKKIEIEQQNLVEPETSKEVSRYSPKANPSAKPEIYKTLDVFKQSTSEGTIIKGSPKSKLSSVNSKFASIFSDSDLMQTSKWEVYKIDSLGRITFSATDDKGRVHELDWTSAGAANDFYVKIAKILNFKFEKFVVDRLNNRLIKKPAKYLADNPRNNEYTSAAVTNPYINCSDIDDVKVIFASNQYNGFYLPLYVEGNNSIDISFDYMIKYDSETLYDCVGNYDRFCGLPAIFNRNSLNNIDCVNFAIFIDSDDSANATQIRNDLYDVYYNSPDQKKEILQEFQEYGLQAEPTAECCEALGGRLVDHDDWSYINELWVKNINNKYKELLNDPTDIANILDSTDLTSQTKIVDVIISLIQYRNDLDKIRADCMTFTAYNYRGEPCDTMNFYIELITTQQVCALEVTEKCGIYSKILWDFNGILAEIEYMLQVVDSCVQTQARVGNLITEIDAEIVEISTELSKTGDNSSTEIENTELEIEALDKNLTLVTVDISAKEEDNDAIAVALVDTEPESDCTIYEEQIEELNNFSVSDYCKVESRNKDFYNKKEEINFYNTCIKEKTNALNKEKQTYIRLREECKKLVSLNGELVEAKNKNQTDVIPALEKTISETKHTIDNICEECGSIVATNESLQLNRKLNTADIAVINRVAVILNTTPAKISDNDKLSLTDDEKIKLKVIQTKNTVSLNKWNSEVSNINESKSKKEQSIAKLKREETLNKKELNKSLDSVINQKGRLENSAYTGPSDPMGGIDIGRTTTEGEEEQSTIYYRKAQQSNDYSFVIIEGCTDPAAINYNDLATIDDGSCQYIADPVDPLDDSSDPEKCCENVEEWLNILKTKMVTTYSTAYSTTHQKYGLGNVLELTNNCYDEWYQQILSDYNIYINEVANSYLTYLNNLSLDFNIEVNNCLQGACPLSHVDSNIITTPYGVEDLWDFKYINTDYSGVIIEGDKSGDVIASIYQEIANITSQITPPQTMSQTLFDPKWRTFNYSLPGNVCDLLKICYPGKEFFMSLEIENFDCGVCILIDNIKINTNSYIVDNITASNDCLIPELTCIIDNKKSWVYTDKGVKVKTTYPAGPCTSGITDGSVILTTPQNRLWQDLEYRYTEYDVNHSNLILNTKSASISIDPAKSIECDVYNFWRQINCDECPTTCDSGTTILYDGVIRETSSASLSAYTLSLSGTPAGISFSCDTYTDILTSEVSNLKNKYYSLTADLNESLSATYDDLKALGGSLSNFTIQENNCESQTLIIGDYKDLDELFGLLIEESDGTLGFWETYVYNTTTPFVGGNHIEIFNGYTAQTFNQTSGVTEECCKSINTILNGTGKLGMGLGKEYEWNTSLNACTWTSIGDCNGDCEYSGTKDVNIYEDTMVYGSDNFTLWFTLTSDTTIDVMYDFKKPLGAYQLELSLPSIASVTGGASATASFLPSTNPTTGRIVATQITAPQNTIPTGSGTLCTINFSSNISSLFGAGDILNAGRMVTSTIVSGGTGNGGDIQGDGVVNILDVVSMYNGLLGNVATVPSLKGASAGSAGTGAGNMSGYDGVENLYGEVSLSIALALPNIDAFDPNFEDLTLRGHCSGVREVPDCINPLNYLDTPPDKIGAKQVFDDLVLKNLIDAKSRQTISGYPLLQLFYQLYLNANNCGKDLSGKLTYNNLFEFMDKIGDYWLDLIEQVVPTTTIWEGCEPSGKIYRNTIFDQNKYPYKKYTLNYIEIPEQCDSVAGVTSESIGQATVDIKVIEDCTAGGCLDESYVKCRREEYLIGVQMQAIQKEIDFIDEQISAYDGGQTTTLNCQYTQTQIDKLQNIDRPYYVTQKGLLQTEKTNKSNECDGISNDIIAANNQLAAVEQSCSSVASRISVAETKLTTLDVNTLPYEKQKTYIAVLKNEYRKCMRSTEVNISNYNTVFITQIYDSNEFEGNVIVLGDDEWDGDGDATGDQSLPGAFYNTELIHNCND